MPLLTEYSPGPACAACKLHAGCRSPVMPGRGAVDGPLVAVVGEMPGQADDSSGQPFVGTLGRLITDAFADLGLDPEAVFYTNAVRCRPPNNELSATTLKHCRGWLLDELASVAPKFILALGNAAIDALVGRRGITALRGKWYEIEAPDHVLHRSTPVFAAFHPAFVMRNPAAFDTLAGDLCAFVDAVMAGGPVAEAPPAADYRVIRTSADAVQFRRTVASAARLAWDIETRADRTARKVAGPFDDGAAVVCVQFSTAPGNGWLVPVDHEECAEWGDESLDREERVEIVRELLESPSAPPLRGQNLKYDTGFVRQVLKIEPRRPVFDCYIAHHLLREDESVTGGNGLKEMAWKYTALGGYEEAAERKYPGFYAMMHRVPLSDLLGYACGDTDVSLRVEDALWPKLVEEGLQDVLQLELEKQDFLVEMELVGAYIDWDYNADLCRRFPEQQAAILRQLRAFPEVKQAESLLRRRLIAKDCDKLLKQIADLQVELAAALSSGAPAGVVSRKRRSVELRKRQLAQLEATAPEFEFNPNSPDQMSLLIFEVLGLPPLRDFMTAKGQAPSTAKGAIAQWCSDLPKASPARQILETATREKRLTKIFGTYIKPLPELRGTDGRVHTTFNQGRVVTWRLSSEGPNFQNLPRDDEALSGDEVGKGDVKRQFAAPPGWWVAEADYAQVELRIAALLSQDPVMLRCFQAIPSDPKGVDLHRLLASRAFPVSRELREMVTGWLEDRGVDGDAVAAALAAEIDKVTRTRAKMVNFGFIYGRTAASIAKANPDISLKTAEKFVTEAQQLFRGYIRWTEDQIKFLRAHGYTESLFGHRRHQPNIDMLERELRGEAMRAGYNHPVQCTASNLNIYAGMLTNQFYRRERLASRVFGQVHDSLWVTGPDVERDDALIILRTVMENMDFPWLRGEDLRFPVSVPILADLKVGRNLRDLEPIDLR